MKRKFIALLLSMVSVASLFAACNDDPVAEPCTTHVDTDKNAVCDACGKELVYIKDQVIQGGEEAVDMVVNPIPAEAVKSDYVKDVVDQEAALPTEETLFDIWSSEEEDVTVVNLNVQTTSTDSIYKVTYTEIEWTNTDPAVEVKRTNHIVIYDIVNQKELYHFASKTYKGTYNDYPYESYDLTDYAIVSVASYGFKVVENRYERPDNYSRYQLQTTYSYYTLAGELVYANEIEPEFTYGFEEDYYTVTLNDTKYAIDRENFAILYSSHKDVFVNRPSLDVVQGNYGYVKSYNGVYVYDLTSWINCVYVYEAPTNVMAWDYYVLANGNVLVQSKQPLPADAISYDVIESVQDTATGEVVSNKYDFVQTIINPVEGTETDVEFGYVIDDFVSGASEDGAEFLVSAEHNAFMVTAIEGKLYSTKQWVLITDSSLNILYGEDAEEFEKQKVGEDLYMKEVLFGDGSYAEAVVNGKGEVVTYLPYDYEACNGFIVVESRVYNWKMELLMDLEEEGYSVIGDYLNDTSMILKKVVEEVDPENAENTIFVTHYYYYNPAVNAEPVQIDSKTETTTVAYYAVNSYDGYYTMRKTVKSETVGEPDTVTYLVYNADNALIGEFESYITDVSEISYSDMYVVETSDGAIYFLR